MEPLLPTDPPYVGTYRLTGRLGSGGMGQVYLARTSSGRRLVIKVIRPGLALDDAFRARFAREAETARRVGGFHTAQVVDADPDSETPWIATTYIPGPTLEQAVRTAGPIAAPALHVLALGLAEGLQAVHACGLVHRDLKPANIILADDGPRIIDFGIARPVDADSMTTQGAVFGTLPYMSPEQTEGSRVGPASDVFSLGTVLTYAATAVNPFLGETMAATLRRLITPPPDPGDIDADVRALITDCWNHDPGRRPTPDQILTRFTGVDVHGSWPPPHAGGARGGEQSPPPDPASDPPHTPPGTGPADTGPGTGSGSGPADPDTGDTGPATGPPSPGPDPAEASTDLHGTLRRTRLQDQPAARRSMASRWPGVAAGAVALLVVSALIYWGATEREADSAPDPAVEPSASPLTHATPSPGATPDPTLATTFDTLQNLVSIAFSPDNRVLATGDPTGVTTLWDVATGERITTLSGDAVVASVAFSPDGAMLATGHWNMAEDGAGEARLWDTATWEEIATLDTNARSVAFSPDGDRIATPTSDDTVRLWETGSHQVATTLGPLDTGMVLAAFSPDGERIATSGYDRALRLWDVGTGELVSTFEENQNTINSMTFSPDGDLLATGDSDGRAHLWDSGTGEYVTTFEADFGQGDRGRVRVYSLAFSADGGQLMAGGYGDGDDGPGDIGGVALWDVDTGDSIAVIGTPAGESALSPDGGLLAIADALAGDVQLWELY